MKTKKFLSMAALALVGAVMTSCSNEDDFTVEPENKSNVVTLTTTVGIGGGAGTRALAADGTKTFAAGETMAIVYTNTNGETAVAVSEALQGSGDITNEGKSATFTVTLDSPDKTQNVTYVYPAAMVNNDGSVKNDALASQDGTLASLGSNLDYCTNSGAWDNGALPELTLDNQFAILALTLKNGAGSREITSSITGLTVSDGTNTYTVSPSSLSKIYVAIQPTTAALELTATDGSKNYTKTATSREYAASNGYSLPLRMLTVISWSQSELEGIPSMSDNGSRTLKGVTLTKSEGTFYTYDVGKYFGGVFQFSSILGNLTKIEVTTSYGSPIGTGWNGNVWTGNASTVDFEDAFNATNIVFTIAEDDVAVSSISLNKTSTSIEKGNTETLTATISPAEATDKSVTWTSSDPSVATVDASGVVTAVAAGEATITAEASNGLTATCTVTVTAPAAPSLLSLTIGGYATIYYAAGETWGQAISRHSSENARWSYEDGFTVYYDNSYLVNMNSDEMVYEDETINPSTTYALF